LVDGHVVVGVRQFFGPATDLINQLFLPFWSGTLEISAHALQEVRGITRPNTHFPSIPITLSRT
jgi:hypothetical protein